MAERATVAKIAEACGVSIGTVDRALNRRPGISAATAARVLAAAEKMGYRANPLAGALSRKNRKKIALIYPSAPRDFYSCMEKGALKAEKELSVYGLELQSFRYGVRTAEEEQHLLESISPEDFDAAALDPLNPASASFVKKFTDAGRPVALFNNDLPKSGRLFFLGADSLHCGKMAGEMIGSLLNGRGSVLVLGNYTDSMPFTGRYQGISEAAGSLWPGLQLYTGSDCRHDESLTEQNIRGFISRTEGNRAVFCTSYSSTLDAVKVLRRLNRRDISLIGFDVSEYSAQAMRDGFCKALIYQDPFLQAYKTLELLSRCVLQGSAPEQKEIYAAPRIVFRGNLDDYSEGILKQSLLL